MKLERRRREFEEQKKVKKQEKPFLLSLLSTKLTFRQYRSRWKNIIRTQNKQSKSLRKWNQMLDHNLYTINKKKLNLK